MISEKGDLQKEPSSISLEGKRLSLHALNCLIYLLRIFSQILPSVPRKAFQSFDGQCSFMQGALLYRQSNAMVAHFFP